MLVHKKVSKYLYFLNNIMKQLENIKNYVGTKCDQKLI